MIIYGRHIPLLKCCTLQTLSVIRTEPYIPFMAIVHNTERMVNFCGPVAHFIIRSKTFNISIDTTRSQLKSLHEIRLQVLAPIR